MQIQGKLEIEGIILQVNIQAPDETRELYVTNVNPNCIIVPKERWRVEHLGLAPEVLREVQDKGIRTLAELVDDNWQVSQNGLSEATREGIKETLSRFRSMAIIFERPQEERRRLMPVSSQITKEEGDKSEREPLPITPLPQKIIKASLTTALSQLGLWEKSVHALWFRYKVRTLGELLKLGRAKVVMTPGMTHTEIGHIENRLARQGYSWGDWSEEKETGMADQGGPPPESAEHLQEQHLTQEGLRKAL